MKKKLKRQPKLDPFGAYRQRLFNCLRDSGMIALQSEMDEVERIVLDYFQPKIERATLGHYRSHRLRHPFI